MNSYKIQYRENIKRLKTNWRLITLQLFLLIIYLVIIILLVFLRKYLLIYIVAGAAITTNFVLILYLKLVLEKKIAKCPACNKNSLRGLQKYCPDCGVLLYDGEVKKSITELVKFSFKK